MAKEWEAVYTWYRKPSLSAPTLVKRDPLEARKRYKAAVKGSSKDFVLFGRAQPSDNCAALM